MARRVDTIPPGSFWGNFWLEGVVKESLIAQAEGEPMSIIRAVGEMKTMDDMALFSENDPKMTPFAKMTPYRGSGINVNLYC